MGALAESGARYKAPWPNATPEEDFAYSQSVELGNSEFEREVANYGGPVMAPYIDADKATMLDTKSYNVMGVYRHEDSAGKPMTEGDLQAYGPALRDAGVEEFVSGEPTILGTMNARPEIWQHEFNHRRHDVADLSPILGEKRAIHLQDAFRANSPERWAEAVSTWYSINKHKFSAENGDTMRDVSDHLNSTLDAWHNELIKSEVKARKKKWEGQGDQPKEREGRFWGKREGSLREDAEEQAELRKRQTGRMKESEKDEEE